MARFPPEMRAASPNESAMRTTNGAEAFNRHIKESVGNAHPNIFCLANVLLQIQEETYVKLQSSESVRRMTRSDRENAHAVLSNYNLYANDDISVLDYLRRICFKFLPFE